MFDVRKLGNNIRSLRRFLGETQEKLGELLNVEKSTISAYENGKRSVDKDTLTMLSRHFGTSRESLIEGDFDCFGNSRLPLEGIENTIFYDQFPIIESERACGNDSFNRGIGLQKKVMEILKNDDKEAIQNDTFHDIYMECIDMYEEARGDDCARVESSANIIGLGMLLFYLSRIVPQYISHKHYALYRDEDFDEDYGFDLSPEALEAEREEFKDVLSNSDISEYFRELINIVKQSGEYSDVADYYLAMRYFLGLVDTEYSLEMNMDIGMEMMDNLILVKNPYALAWKKSYLDFIRKIPGFSL